MSGSARGRGFLWTGRILSVLPILLLTASATLKLTASTEMTKALAGRLGYPEPALLGIALLELACAAVYAIPRSAVLGAVLMTGFLGGAIASHVRVDDLFMAPLVPAILAWIGLWLREPRLRALFPLRSKVAP